MSEALKGNPFAEMGGHGLDGLMPAFDTVAFELRTANLIAFLDQCNRNGGAGPEVHALQRQVIVRLGLE